MTKFSSVSAIDADAEGWGFFLCARKEVRAGRSGSYMALQLQDATGQIEGKVFQDVERLQLEFDAGDFVKVQGRGNRFKDRTELLVDKIRRVDPTHDAAQGFSERACVPSAPRSDDEMWPALTQLVESVENTFVRTLLARILDTHEEQLRHWPAAQTVHHAYRSGLLEHILKVADVATALASAYDADRDLVIAGAILHDIGKLQELDYDVVTRYSLDGNLVGHITLGVVLVRTETERIGGFPDALRAQIEHLIVSHHGSKEFGAPVEPRTVEGFILAAADDLDAKIHQVRRHVAEDQGDDEFTSFHRRLQRSLFKGSSE
jgi:3'-5' exoribonuclease